MGDLQLLARLNIDTQPHHADADLDVEQLVFRPDVTRGDYASYLSRIYGFVAPLEAALASVPGLSDIIDVRPRAKAMYVLHDLLALGVSMAEIAELPQCLSIPAFRGPAAALGWMYVVERPMLSSAVLHNHLQTSLGGEIADASSYVTCYAGQVGAMWRELGLALDNIADAGAIADRIVAAANDAFACQHRWRALELARWNGFRQAG